MRHFIACSFLVACFAFAGGGPSARAATYQVGPSRTFKKLQDVAPLLAVGTAQARPSDGLINIGAYEYAP